MQGEPVFDPAPFEHIKTDYVLGAVGGPRDGEGPRADYVRAIDQPDPIAGRCPLCARPWDDHPGWLLAAPNLKPLCS